MTVPTVPAEIAHFDGLLFSQPTTRDDVWKSAGERRYLSNSQRVKDKPIVGTDSSGNGYRSRAHTRPSLLQLEPHS